MEDRRIFERFQVSFPLKFLNSKDDREGQARVCDVSAKGVGIIVTNKRLKPSTGLELWLGIPDKGEPLYARGKVVWLKPQGSREYRCGISLDKADLMGLSRILRLR